MEELTIKVKITPSILAFIKKQAVSTKQLTPLACSYWKPKGVALKEFSPNKKVIRLRSSNANTAWIDELDFFSRDGSYTHGRVRLFEGSVSESEAYLQKKNYEKWGEIRLRSIEHQLRLPSSAEVNALEEVLNGKKTLVKFEAKSKQEVEEIKNQLQLSPQDLILKNRAELFAEEKGLI